MIHHHLSTELKVKYRYLVDLVKTLRGSCKLSMLFPCGTKLDSFMSVTDGAALHNIVLISSSKWKQWHHRKWWLESIYKTKIKIVSKVFFFLVTHIERGTLKACFTLNWSLTHSNASTNSYAFYSQMSAFALHWRTWRFEFCLKKDIRCTAFKQP